MNWEEWFASGMVTTLALQAGAVALVIRRIKKDPGGMIRIFMSGVTGISRKRIKV